MAEDDLSDLTAAWDATTPRPDPGVRAAHLRLAQENFARLHASQVAPPAPPKRFRAWFETLTGRGGLTAATALAACGVLVLTPDGREIWRGSPIEMGPEVTETASTKQAPAGGPALEEAEASEEAPASDDDVTYTEAEAAPEIARSAPTPETAQEKAGPALGGEIPSDPENAREMTEADSSGITATLTATAGEVPPRASDQPSTRLSLPDPVPSEPALSEPALSDEATQAPAPEATIMAAPADDADGSGGDRAAGVVTPDTPGARLVLPSPQVTASTGSSEDASRSADLALLSDEFADAEAAPPSTASDATATPPAPAPEVESAQAAPVDPAAIPAPPGDVPQGSFEEVSEALRSGQRPSPEMVRIEELVAAVLPEPPSLRPQDGGVVPSLSVQPAPWASGASLVLVTVGRAGEDVEGLSIELTWDPAVVEATPLAAATDGGPLLHEVRPRAGATGPWGVLRLLWTEDDVARASEVPILGTEAPDPDVRLAAAVAGWGLLLRGELDLGAWNYEDAAQLAEENLNGTPLAAGVPDLIRLSARIDP